MVATAPREPSQTQALSRIVVGLNNGTCASLCYAGQLGYTATFICAKGRRPMFRLLFWIALIAIAIWLYRRNKTRAASPKQSKHASQVMVRCAHCELHVLQQEALERAGNWYCSSQHLELGPRKLDQ